MTSFAKAKIGFALTLLAVLFAIYPIIQEQINMGFVFFGFLIKIRFLYYTFALLLGVAVYTYAIAFISDRFAKIIQRIGNIIYAVALVIPPLCGILWIVSLLLNAITSLAAGSFLVRVILLVLLSLLMSPVIFFVAYLLEKKLNSKDKEARLHQLSQEEASHVERASEMLRAGNYDLSVFEGFKAIESALRKRIEEQEMRIANLRDILTTSKLTRILPYVTLNDLEEISNLRNDIVHAGKPVDRDLAKYIFQKTRDISGMIARQIEIDSDKENK